MLEAAREVPKMRGGEKKAIPEEQVTIDFAFATAVAIQEIQKGELLTRENTWVKRPGTGEIPAEEYENILGRRAVEDIPFDTQIRWGMIE